MHSPLLFNVQRDTTQTAHEYTRGASQPLSYKPVEESDAGEGTLPLHALNSNTHATWWRSVLLVRGQSLFLYVYRLPDELRLY